ncbi:hypothetical protein [Pseudohongiella nitratireducens]|uniref:hypothetical protein n=1 Tax=Pseudohongiella nitratireducens TaxID=1768907 RepID=UPI0030EE19EF
MRSKTFRKTMLSQAIIAGLSLGATGTALAAPDSDFYLTGNSVTIGGNVASVSTNGVISTTTVTRATNTSTLPNVTLPLADLQTAGNHTIRLGLQATLGSSILEVRLGVVTLSTNASGDITAFELLDSAGDPGFEKTYAWVRLSGNVTVTTEFDVPAGMVTRSGNNLTLNMSTIINEISAQGGIADALAAFTTTGTISYKLAIYQTAGTEGPAAARLGHYNAANTPAFVHSGQTVKWNDATLDGNFTGASVLSGSLIIQAAGTPPVEPEEPDDTTTVDESDINDLEDETEAVDQEVDDQIDSGNVTTETVTKTVTVANKAATQTSTLVTGSTTGTISTPNTLNVLVAATGSAQTGGKVANSTTTADKTAVTASTKTIIKDTGKLLTTIADSGTTITTEQKTQVQNIIVNLAGAAKNITGGATGKTATALEMKKDMEAAFKAATKLKVPLSDETQTVIKEAAVSIQVAALAELTGKNSEELTQEDLQAAFNDPVTREKVLAASPTLPNANPRSEEDVTNDINNYIAQNYPQRPTGTTDYTPPPPPGLSSLSLTPVTTTAIVPFTGFSIGEQVTFTLIGENGAGVSLSLQVPQLMAATDTEANTITISGDTTNLNSATATLDISVGDTTFKVAPLGLKAVPAGLSPTINVQPDGRMIMINSDGTALEIAATANDIIAMSFALNDLGYPITNRDDGSFELALAGNDKFTGAFAYEDLSSDSTVACGDMTFTPADVEVNQPDYVFTASCANGVSQSIVPFVAETGFYDSVDNAGILVSTDRNTGIITVAGIGKFKPSFFSTAPTDAEAEYQAQNADSLGFAYMPTDVNGDGRMDYKLITGTRTQVMYAVP